MIIKTDSFDHELICSLIKENSNILDLGCGDGSLMQKLKKKNCICQGIEIDSEKIKACIQNGMPVVQENIDYGLLGYKNNCFDYVILCRTLQATYKPLSVIKESVRVGSKVIISFPNFAYFIIRAQLFFGGVMPRSKDLPYEWYNTPNIHLVSIKDFERLCRENNFQVHKKLFFYENKIYPKILNNFANLLSPYALFVISK